MIQIILRATVMNVWTKNTCRDLGLSCYRVCLCCRALTYSRLYRYVPKQGRPYQKPCWCCHATVVAEYQWVFMLQWQCDTNIFFRVIKTKCNICKTTISDIFKASTPKQQISTQRAEQQVQMAACNRHSFLAIAHSNNLRWALFRWLNAPIGQQK